MRYTFGPINSRRFGLSLGIDLSPNDKSCNFDCLYCELNSSKTTDKIENPPKVEDIINDVKYSLSKNPNVDVITITSNGEPTLYEDLDLLVDELNKIKGDKELLILSNASRIDDTNIQHILKKIDIVKLSLDCVSPKCFKKIDRPHNNISIEKIIKGIEDFSKNFTNKLIIEILVVKGINDTETEIKSINKVINIIKPTRVDLGTIDRPPAFDVKSVSTQKLIELSKFLTNIPVSIIYKSRPKSKIELNKEEIIDTIKRRPQSQFDVDYLFSDNSKKNLQVLIQEGKVDKQIVTGIIFYTLI